MATGLNTGLVEIGTMMAGTRTVVQQGSSIVYGHVLDVITDTTSKYYEDATSIGSIRFKNLHDPGADEDSINTIAYPIDRTDYTLPLPGEQVIIIPAYGPNVEGLYTVRYYYSSIVSVKSVVNDNIIPFLGSTGNKGSNLEKLKSQLSNAFGPVAANRFISKIKHDQKILQQKTIQEQPREGDKIIEGRYGGVIKFTSTIEKDSSQRSAFPTAGSVDGDPLLVIKNNRKQSVQTLTYTDDVVNAEDVSVYLTTSQKLPISLGCSKKLYTWNGNKVAGINANNFYDGLNKSIQARALEQAKQLPQQTTVLQTQAGTINELNTGTNTENQQVIPTDADIQNAYPGGMLSKYLSYDVAIASPTAQSYNISNKPGDKELKNISGIGYNIYDRMCDHFGIKIVVSSCFRSKTLNTAIGGAITSQHTLGEALDLDVNKLNNPKLTNKDLFLYIAKNLDFDQLIWELGNDNQPDWVHVSYGVTKQTQRHQILKFQGKSASPQYAQVNGNSTLEKQLGLA